MSLTYGFYNAINHDRTYDAVQMSSIFDGIINDGVFMSIGDHLNVTVNSGMVVNVGTGRAWFDHTWTLNDAIMTLTVGAAESVLKRIDAVVLEVNSANDVRANSIKIIQGTPGSDPVAPELTNNEEVKQHYLATILVEPGVTELSQAKITNKIGTSDTPFITGILETMNVDMLIAQWQTQLEEQMIKNDTTFSIWYEEKRAQFVQLYNLTEAECEELVGNVDEMIATAQARLDGEETEFNEWLSHLKNELDEHQAANLQNQIDNIVGMTDADVDAIFD